MSGILNQDVMGLLLLFGVLALFATRRLRLKRRWTRGCDAFNQGKMEEAERLFRRCLKSAPEVAAMRRMLAVVLVQRGIRKEAEEHFRLAADLEPRNPEGHLHLALFLASSGSQRFDEAIDAIEKALTAAPTAADIVRKDARFSVLRGNPRFDALLPIEE